MIEQRHHVDTLDHREDWMRLQELYGAIRIDQAALTARNRLGATLAENNMQVILRDRMNTLLEESIKKNLRQRDIRINDRNTTLWRIWDAVTRRSRNAANDAYAAIYEAGDITTKVALLPPIQITGVTNTFGAFNLAAFNDPFWVNNSLADIYTYLRTGQNPTTPTFTPPAAAFLAGLNRDEREAVFSEIIGHPDFQTFVELRRIHGEALMDLYKTEVVFDQKRLDEDFFQRNFQNDIQALGIPALPAVPGVAAINFTDTYWCGPDAVLNTRDKVRGDLKTAGIVPGTIAVLTDPQIDILFDTQPFRDYFRLRDTWFARENLNNYIIEKDRNRGIEEKSEYKLIVAHLLLHPEDFGEVALIRKNIADIKTTIEKQEQDVTTFKELIKLQSKYQAVAAALAIAGIPAKQRAELMKEQTELTGQWTELTNQLNYPPAGFAIAAANSATNALTDLEYRGTGGAGTRLKPADTTLLKNKADLLKLEAGADAGGDTLKKGTKISAREMLFRLYRSDLKRGRHYQGEKALDRATMMEVSLDLINVEDKAFEKLNGQLSQLFIDDRDGLFWRPMLNRIDRGWRENNFISANFFAACGWGMAKLFMEAGASFKDAKDKFFQQDVSAWIDNVKRVVMTAPSGATSETTSSLDSGKKSAADAKVNDLKGKVSSKETELKDAQIKLVVEKDDVNKKTLQTAIDAFTKELESLKTELSSAQSELATAETSAAPVTEQKSATPTVDLFEINKHSTIDDIRLAVSRGKLDQEKLFRIATMLTMVLKGYEVYKKKYKLEDRSVRDIAFLEILIRNLKLVRSEMMADKLANELEPVSNEARAKKLTELFNSQIAEDDRLHEMKMKELEPESAEWKKAVLEHGANKPLTSGWTKKKAKAVAHWANTPNRKIYEYYKQNGLIKTLGKGAYGALYVPRMAAKGVKAVVWDAPKAVGRGALKGVSAIKQGTVNAAKATTSGAGKVLKGLGKAAIYLTPLGFGLWLWGAGKGSSVTK